jgi:putative Holliday junction resolvase
MKALGIDYGTKKIGLAISSEDRKLAFPYGVYPNNEKFYKTLRDIITKEHITHIVIGKSLNFKRAPNSVMKDIEAFKEMLEKEHNKPISFIDETFTTKEAERLQGKHKKIDASAAALILSTYLEQKKG